MKTVFTLSALLVIFSFSSTAAMLYLNGEYLISAVLTLVSVLLTTFVISNNGLEKVWARLKK
jgi:hypothetical protein